MLPLESILANFRRGLIAYEQHLGRKPAVFARRRFGLTPVLPGILRGLGFRGAIHCTLDEGRFPQSDSTKTRWEGVDGAEVEAIGRVPLEANRPGAFIQLAERIGHAMDHDHIATLCFAHWPGQTSPFYEDIRRITAIAPVFGRFLALDDYFASTEPAGTYSRFTHDEYRSPFLQQAAAAGQADPLSRWVRFYRDFAEATSRQTLDTLATLLRRSAATPAQAAAGGDLLPSDPSDERSSDRSAADRAQCVARLAAALPRGKGDASLGYLAFNPLSFGRRVLVQLPKLAELPAMQAPIKAVETTSQGNRAIIDLPPLGFAWIGPAAGEPGRNWSGDPLATGHSLRNEFFELTIHPTTGGIQSLHDFRTRGNRLSQQLVFCARNEAAPAAVASPGKQDSPIDPEAGSRMVAESIEITDGGLLRGEITSRGQLLDAAGARLANFVQRVQMTLGSRVATIEIELDPLVTPGADPWTSYFGVRYAWGDRAAEVRRGVHLGSFITRAKRLDAPQFVEVNAAEGRTLLLSGGLPFHARIGPRMLDTLLIAAGETLCRFRLGLGVDVAPILGWRRSTWRPPKWCCCKMHRPPLPSTTGGSFIST